METRSVKGKERKHNRSQIMCEQTIQLYPHRERFTVKCDKRPQTVNLTFGDFKRLQVNETSATDNTSQTFLYSSNSTLYVMAFGLYQSMAFIVKNPIADNGRS